jgi:hypothetical protein
MSGMLQTALHGESITKLLLTHVQEVLDMTDTLPSSQIRVVSTKSVCRAVITASFDSFGQGQELNTFPRVCIQGHHRRQHHFGWCERQRLCRGHLTEESPGLLNFPSTCSSTELLTLPLINRTSSSIPLPYPMSTSSLPRSAAS